MKDYIIIKWNSNKKYVEIIFLACVKEIRTSGPEAVGEALSIGCLFQKMLVPNRKLKLLAS